MMNSLRCKVLITIILLTLILQSPANSTSPVKAAAPDYAGSPLPDYSHLAVEENSSSSIFLPVVLKNAKTQIQPVIPATTKVLWKQTQQFLTAVSPDSLTLTYSSLTQELQAVRVGDIIIGSPCELMPLGFLREVVRISTQGSKTVIQTVNAPLTEAIHAGRISASGVLTLDAIQKTQIKPGVELLAQASSLQSQSLFYEIKNVVLYDKDSNPATISDQIRANGSISITPKYSTVIDIENNKLERFNIYYWSDEVTDLTITSSIDKEAGLPIEMKIASHRFQPVQVMVGTAPVWITPVLSVFVGFRGSTVSGITTYVRQEASIMAGAKCSLTACLPLSELENQFQFNIDPIYRDFQSIEYAGLGLSLWIYDQDGVDINTNARRDVIGTTLPEPTVDLMAGMEAWADVMLTTLDDVIFDSSAIIIDTKELLWQWLDNDPPNLPASPVPANSATNQDINPTLSWTGGDSDGDAVTYDVYFQAGVNPPTTLASNDQSTMTFTPGTLSYATIYYWQVISRDEHEATTSGPVWTFTTKQAPNHPPAQPTTPSPANNAINQSIDVNLSWMGTDPDGDDLTYDVYLQTDTNPPVELVSDDQVVSTYDPGLLAYDTQYYWRIVVTDEHGATTSGPVWTFTTGAGPNHPPNTPSVVMPIDGETGVDPDTDLSWTGGDSDGDVVSYNIYLQAETNPPATIVKTGHDQTTYNPGPLLFGMTYYWQIIARDEHGLEVAGPVWSFTTVVSGEMFDVTLSIPYREILN